jgi:HEAT repeat protein
MNRRGVPFCFALAVMLSGWCTGCDAPPIKPVLTDPDPSVKIPAIELAARQHDMSAIPTLINNLDSADPAIRFYANDALRKLTGQDFDYLFYADQDVRRPAVLRWKAWYAASNHGSSVRCPAAASPQAVQP